MPRAKARATALDQDVTAAAVLVLSADRAALAAHARRYRHAFLEAGLVDERIYLKVKAAARGLGVFYDDEASALVGADPARGWEGSWMSDGNW